MVNTNNYIVYAEYREITTLNVYRHNQFTETAKSKRFINDIDICRKHHTELKLNNTAIYNLKLYVST